MGRKQYLVVKKEQLKLYRSAREEFDAPTTDPSVAWARNLIRDEERQRAVRPTLAQTTAGYNTTPWLPIPSPDPPTDSAPESPVIFASDPEAIARAWRQDATEIQGVYDSWIPLQLDSNPIPPSLRHLSILGSPAPLPPPTAPPHPFEHERTRSSSPPIFYDSSYDNRNLPDHTAVAPPPLLSHAIVVPVVWADTIGSATTNIHRYAILGPAEAGLVQRDRLFRLANANTNTIMVRKNHGTSASKPCCTVIEAEYTVHGISHVLILLAANIIVHSAFSPETNPSAMYVGNTPDYHLLDQLGTSPNAYDYGVPIEHYRQCSGSEVSVNEELEVNRHGDE
ncbi:hypothetical protein C8R47DRAFT_1209161 [Mycena vitilis]|nr:hypothetical protein C8R47DRAFT_1209161 [Mycena vitilis]